MRSGLIGNGKRGSDRKKLEKSKVKDLLPWVHYSN